MTLNTGLEGVAVAETEISEVDGQNGRLIFRGQFVQDVVKKHGYEEAVYLIWNGHYPNDAELAEFRLRIKEQQALPDYMKRLIELMPKTSPVIQVIRTAVSAMQVSGESWPPTWGQAIEIFAKIPTIIAYFYRLSQGKTPIDPSETLDYTANYLHMLTSETPNPMHVRALEGYLILLIDHGMNASTFTSRVVSSTRENMVGSITAAIAALEGPLHGGAPSEVDEMLELIGSGDNAEAWIREKLEKGERLMGFGHRVYKTYDPRGAALKEVTKELVSDDSPLFKFALNVEEIAVRLLKEYKPGRNLYPNTEYWAACVLKTVGLPKEVYTPTFCMCRVAGWSAHIMEQSKNNRLIRPSSVYVGPMPD